MATVRTGIDRRRLSRSSELAIALAVATAGVVVFLTRDSAPWALLNLLVGT